MIEVFKVQRAVVFPAHAGMDRACVDRGVQRGSVFPAHAGMDQRKRMGRPTREQCSPHTRGWTATKPELNLPTFVFPAHAGMDRGLYRAER